MNWLICFKEILPEDSKVILLRNGYDYIPSDNEELLKRNINIETKINKVLEYLGK